MNNLPGGPR